MSDLRTRDQEAGNLLDWQEQTGCQAWRNPNNTWTASVKHPKKYIQETRGTLRSALHAAQNEWVRFQQ